MKTVGGHSWVLVFCVSTKRRKEEKERKKEYWETCIGVAGHILPLLKKASVTNQAKGSQKRKKDPSSQLFLTQRSPLGGKMMSDAAYASHTCCCNRREKTERCWCWTKLVSVRSAARGMSLLEGGVAMASANEENCMAVKQQR